LASVIFLVAFAFRAEHQIGGQFDILEDELGGVGGPLAELVLDSGYPKTGALGRHQKGADAPLALFGVGHGEDDRDLGILAGGDELGGVAQHPAVAVAPRSGLIAAASEPACGSVRKRQASISPFAIGSRNRRFCSSEPDCQTGMQPTEFCTLSIVATGPRRRRSPP
jgi:hypothetical protein